MRFFSRKRGVSPAHQKPRAQAPPLGAKVSVRLWADTSSGVPGQVTECDGHDFTVDALEGLVLHPEQHVEVSWTQEDNVHVIQAAVLSGEARIYQLSSAQTQHKLPQLRSAERVPWRKTAQIEILTSLAWHKSTTVSVQTIDISSGGVRFATSAPLAPGDHIKLMLEGYEPMTAEVIRSGNIARAWRHHVSARWLHPIKISTER